MRSKGREMDLEALRLHNTMHRDAPLRLADAARIGFPDGSMTASGLRREAARGRLEIERIAGKDFTTLAAIDQMRVACRVMPKISARAFDARLGCETALAAARVTAQNLKTSRTRRR